MLAALVLSLLSLIVPVRPRLRGQTVAKPTTTKKEEDFHLPLFRTQSRGRTGTGVNLLVFETSASTDSAIRADAFCRGKGR